MSYYGCKSISREINCSEGSVLLLRKELISAGLIAFDGKIYQVLDLREDFRKSNEKDQIEGTHSVEEILEKMFGGSSND